MWDVDGQIYQIMETYVCGLVVNTLKIIHYSKSVVLWYHEKYVFP
jgi:hypothetical protein